MYIVALHIGLVDRFGKFFHTKGENPTRALTSLHGAGIGNALVTQQGLAKPKRKRWLATNGLEAALLAQRV